MDAFGRDDERHSPPVLRDGLLASEEVGWGGLPLVLEGIGSDVDLTGVVSPRAAAPVLREKVEG